MMEPLARLTGFFVAHAIWSVSDGGPLVPFVAGEMSNGERTLDRFVAERLEDSVEQARQAFTSNPREVVRLVLAYDGYITLPDGKTDAIFFVARDVATGETLEGEVPYRAVGTPPGFAVFKPKLSVPEAGGGFFDGVDAHVEGAQVWNAHLDQSR